MQGFITPPHLALKIQKMRLELKILQTKKKLFGSLSEAEQKRYDKLLLELNIKY